jgi:hypothetical protein
MSNILGSNRSLGWEAVPDHGPSAEQRNYITKWRQAKIEKRSLSSDAVAAFNHYCEQRSRALGREVRKIIGPLAPAKMTMDRVRFLSKQTGRSFEDIVYGYSPRISEDRWLRMRMESITAIVTRDAQKLKDEKRAALLADTSPAGKIALREYLDVLAGVRPADPGARPYGFQDRSEDLGQPSDPQQSLRSYPSYDDGEDADDEDDHERACRGHRSCAQRASVAHGSAHYRAADLHDLAARQFNDANSQAARWESYRANHFKESMVS